MFVRSRLALTLARFSLVLTPLLLTGCGDDGHAAAREGPAATSGGNALEQDGIRIACAIEPYAPPDPPRPLRRGDTARVTLHVTDTETGQPIRGLKLGAWMLSRPTVDTPAPDAEAVRTIVRKLVSSGLEANGTTNLNSWFYATLNTDRTLTLIDPLLDFSRTRMKQVIELPCQGTDLALGPDDLLMFLALPERGEVAVVDTAGMTLRDSLLLGEAPTQLEVQPITGTVWAADARGPSIHAIDGRTGAAGTSVRVGPGPKMLAFDAEGQWTFAAARETGEVLAVATVDGGVRQLLRCDTPLTGLAWSDTAQELHVLAADGRMFAVRVDGTAAPAQQPLPAGSGPLWAVLGGRFLLAAERAAGRLHVLDAAVRAPARAIPTGAEPCQLDTTDQFAFVFCAGSHELTLVPLAGLADPQSIATMRIPVAQRDPTAPLEVRGDLVVTAPDRMSALVAAPEEKQVYYYAEGMNAPMGAYQNHSRVPVALAVVDRSLREAAPGVYTTIAPLEQLGTVDLYTYLPQPSQFFGRFEFAVEEDPAAIAARERMRPAAVPRPVDGAVALPVGREGRFRFRLHDEATDAQLADCADVHVLVHARYGNWQVRLPARTAADGTYEVPLTLPEKGPYRVRVQCPQHRLSYATHRPMDVEASDDVEGRIAPTATPQATPSPESARSPHTEGR
ncbi:MAG: YncE family protein [Planctomycetota bacterium]